MTMRDLDSVICGICGVAGEVYLGDGNEKNCCDISEVCCDIHENLYFRNILLHVFLVVVNHFKPFLLFIV